MQVDGTSLAGLLFLAPLWFGAGYLAQRARARLPRITGYSGGGERAARPGPAQQRQTLGPVPRGPHMPGAHRPRRRGRAQGRGAEAHATAGVCRCGLAAAAAAPPPACAAALGVASSPRWPLPGHVADGGRLELQLAACLRGDAGPGAAAAVPGDVAGVRGQGHRQPRGDGGRRAVARVRGA